jgi:hypothetical protein
MIIVKRNRVNVQLVHDADLCSIFSQVHYALVLHALTKGAVDEPWTDQHEPLIKALHRRIVTARNRCDWHNYVSLFERVKIMTVETPLKIHINVSVDML